MPKISVIIPTNNRSNFIKNALSSAQKQTFKDFEIIIVDDGSCDETYKVISNFNSNIRYIYQPNCGVSSARNMGIQNSRGKLIAFLDSDDLWHPEKLQKQYDFLENNKAINICYTGSYWIRNREKVNPPKRYAPRSGNIFQHILDCCFVGASFTILRRELFDKYGLFDESLPVCEDHDLWIRLAINEAFHYINEPLGTKQMGHWGQLSTKFWGMDRYRIKTLEKLLNSNNLTNEQKSIVINSIKNKSRILAKGCLKHFRPVLFLQYMLKILSLWINSKKYYSTT